MKNSTHLALFAAFVSCPLLFQACNRNLTPSSPFVIPTNTPTFTATPTPTVTGTITVSCVAQATLTFTGNLNSAQGADQPGGILQLGTSLYPVLPFAGLSLNAAKVSFGAYQSGNALFQLANFGQPLDGATHALPNHTQALMTGSESLAAARGAGSTNYAWNQGGAYPPASTVTKNVIDSSGNSRQIKILFYQVNDLGTASPAVNPNPPHQVAYAWYAFETTGGLQPGNDTLIEGTGIMEGDIPFAADRGYDRCVPGDEYWGDFLYFNSDGSLASEGGVWVSGGIAVQDKPYLYLPLDGDYLSINSYPDPNNNPSLVLKLDFGTAGMPGYGQRNGITGDVASSNVN